MAQKTNAVTQLSLETEIELIAISKSNGEVSKKQMKYGDALKIKKRKEWNYYYYQIGFSQFN